MTAHGYGAHSPPPLAEGSHESPQLHWSEQQSLFAWQRRPVSCTGMQQRPLTQIAVLSVQSLADAQQTPTPALHE